MSLIKCGCPCKQKFEEYDDRGRKRKFIHGHNLKVKNYAVKNTVEDFWNNVDKTSKNKCWNWKGNCFSTGYGVFYINYKIVSTHRYSYKLKFGKIPKGLSVLHRCDNRKCCNPYHLYLGIQQENMNDMIERGRSLTGEQHPHHKLTLNQVKKIRKLYSIGKHSQYDLAKIFNVHQSTIWRVVDNITWKQQSKTNNSSTKHNEIKPCKT